MLANPEECVQAEQHDLSVSIRWMIRRDMPQVIDIEADSFEFPWTDVDFTRCFKQRNAIGMIAESDEQVIGYMVYELYKTRLHIINFAVKKDSRLLGVGRKMVDKLKSKLSSQLRTRITLEVSEQNLSGQLFFQHMGFWATKVLKNHYDNDISAYEMEIWYSDKPEAGYG